MCNVCRRTPCAGACPNAPEPAPIHKCKYCKEGIVAGEEYMRHGDDYYHLEDCASDIALELLLELYAAKGVASEYD